jgi:hypothetical protein
MTLSFMWYLKIQAHKRDKFKLLKSGIPRPLFFLRKSKYLKIDQYYRENNKDL